jgi:hypothetical protein
VLLWTPKRYLVIQVDRLDSSAPVDGLRLELQPVQTVVHGMANVGYVDEKRIGRILVPVG